MGYTPGCWKHGSRPDIPARPGSRSPNGLRLAVAYALDGLDGQNPALWAVWTASRVGLCRPKGVGAAYGPPAPIPAACLSPAPCFTTTSAVSVDVKAACVRAFNKARGP
jgi:hypothetical protein